MPAQHLSGTNDEEWLLLHTATISRRTTTPMQTMHLGEKRSSGRIMSTQSDGEGCQECHQQHSGQLYIPTTGPSTHPSMLYKHQHDSHVFQVCLRHHSLSSAA